MRIGLFNNSLPHMGGVHQYTLTMVSALAGTDWGDHDFILFSTVPSPDLRDEARRHGRTFVSVTPRACAFELLRKPTLRYARIALKFALYKALKRRSDQELHEAFLELTRRIVARHRIDLMLYPRIDFETFRNEVPFIACIHDLAHRMYPGYPEVSAGDLWQWREYFFLNASRNALAIFVDSEIGKEDVLNCYCVEPDKVVPLPFLTPDYLDEKVSDQLLQETKSKFALPEEFFFYPAQFWKHKNHINIVNAIHSVREKTGTKLHVVFCGGKVEQWGEYDRVMNAVRDLGLEEQVHYLGYVDDRYLAPLYKLAVALVMPTFMGPTNIPVLEAWEMGCPVITSDIRGCRNQAKDAALLVDPSDPADIGDAMMRIHREAKTRRRLITKGKQSLAQWTAVDFKKRVLQTVEAASRKLDQEAARHWTITPFCEIAQQQPAPIAAPQIPPALPAATRGLDRKRWPLISVITPCYNSAVYLEEAVQSVLRQGYPNFEHIVVDGGSSDGTLGILRRYPHLRWLSLPDAGQSDAMNRGFRISFGEIIVYLNADDFFEPGAFFDAVQFLETDKDARMVAGMCNVAKPDGSVYVPAFVPKTDFFHMMWWWNAWFPINPTSYFYRREVQEEVGGYDVADHYLMDYDFLLKVSLRHDIRVVEHVWGNFRWLETGKSFTRPADLTRRAVSKKYFRRLSLPQKISYYRYYIAHRLDAGDNGNSSLVARTTRKLLAVAD